MAKTWGPSSGLRFQKLDQQSQAAWDGCVLDLLEGDEPRHIRLKEGGGDGGRNERTVGEGWEPGRLLSLAKGEEWLPKPLPNRDIIEFYRSELTEPGK